MPPTVVEPGEAPARPATGGGPIAAAWAAPRWAHALVLAAILVLITLWAGTDTSFSMDEPASILQAQQLSAGEGWLTPNPLPTIDPDGSLFYIVRSDHGSKGISIYAKHAAYPMVLSVLDRVGGQRAMVLLSCAGTVAAALVAAAIARRLDARLDRWALWATGLGSPLLFDSQLVIAHAVAAPCAAGAALLLVDLKQRFRWWPVLAASALLAATSLLRTEGVLYALALAGAALVVAAVARDRRWLGVAAGVLAGGVGVGAIDRWYATSLVGTAITTPIIDDTAGPFLSTRLPAFFGMVLAPGDAWPSGTQLALVLLVAGAIGLGIALRLDRPPRVLVLATAALVALGGVGALVQGGGGTIPSLLVACPLIAAGAAAVGRVALEPFAVRWLGAVCLAYAAMVAVIQYGQGGGVEWGARFLAIVVPVLVPLALWSLLVAIDARTGAGVLDRGAVRLAIAGLAVGSLAVGALGLATIRSFHDGTSRFAAKLDAAARATPGADLGDGDRRPIVVSTWFVVGRLTTGKTVPVRGLSVIAQPLKPVIDRLADAGVDRFVLVVDDVGDLQELDGRYRVVPSPDRPAEGPVFVVERI